MDEQYEEHIDVIAIMEQVCNDIYSGSWQPNIDPTQAKMLGNLLYQKVIKLSDDLCIKLMELGLLYKQFEDEKKKTIENLHNEGKDLLHLSEKKILNMALQKSNDLSCIYGDIKQQKCVVDGIKEKIKNLTYLAKSWNDIIVPIIEQEWRKAGQ